MMTAVVVGCSNDEESNNPLNPDPIVKPEKVTLTRSEQQLVASSNAFSFNLFRMAQDHEESQILSPLSITYALGMLNNGASGETQEQINKVLGFDAQHLISQILFSGLFPVNLCLLFYPQEYHQEKSRQGYNRKFRIFQ